MARSAGKKANQPGSARPSTSQKPATSSTSAATAESSSPPEHFKIISANLRPLVNTLPTDHVYALHVDRTSPALKRQVYTVPILLNIAITAVLAWRVYYAAPAYLDQIITIFGYETAWTVQPSKLGVSGLISTISERTFLLMFDYAIFAMLGSWPWEFMFGSRYTRRTGPAAWRWNLGFRPVEVVVRKGRKWDQALLREVDESRVEKERSLKWSLEEELNFRFKIESALRRSYTAKTGYLLLDKEWDLDFKAMIDINKLVDKKVLQLEDVDHVVLLCWQKQWVVWRVSDAAAEVSKNAETAESDTGLRNFRDHLTDLGAEDVFFRWIEIVQYESSLPGGFSKIKKQEALGELKRLLKKKNIDENAFFGDIGGETAIPGLT